MPVLTNQNTCLQVGCRVDRTWLRRGQRLQIWHSETASLRDELRTQIALKYLRSTTLANEDIALALGFSDAANFRRALHRWTNKAPREIKNRRNGFASSPELKLVDEIKRATTLMGTNRLENDTPYSAFTP